MHYKWRRKKGNSNISTYVIPLPPKYHQYKIGNIGNIVPPEKRRLLMKIDTLEFSKWEWQTKQSITSWVDVFGISWICFGCQGLPVKHTPFCHSAQSYSKCKMEHFNSANLNSAVPKHITHEELVNLSSNESKFSRKLEYFMSCTRNKWKDMMSSLQP